MIEKNSDVYNRTPEWVKKAIFSHLKDSGYSFPKCFGLLIAIDPDGGATITITDKPKPNGKPVGVHLPFINRFLEWAHK